MSEPREKPSRSPSASAGGLLTSTIKEHLAGLGVDPNAPSAREFLEPRLAGLSDPSSMLGRAKAVDRLKRAIAQAESIVVFGDYDCDGMTATAIMTEGLRALSAKSVTPLLASRFDGGYGLSGPALNRVLKTEPQVVVTCDCGSSDHVTLGQLTERGIDVIVIDHHLVPEEPLPVHAFLNPHQPECAFPFKWLASCGLAFSVIAGLRTALAAELNMKRWLDLVAIGTIADVAPLSGDNRALVRAGLQQLVEPKRPGLSALMDLIGLSRGGERRATDVSFRIAPRLNAPGRLGPPDIALELLLETNPEKASMLAATVEQACVTRRQLQATIEAEAREDATRLPAPPCALVVGRAHWNHGIVGIVAGRLAEERGTPVVAIGFEGDVGRGSVRGPAGFPLFDALTRSSAALARFGGHQAAAGLEVPLSGLEQFRSDFMAACEAVGDYERPPERTPLAVHPDDDLLDLYADLLRLEPCGEANPAPRLEFVVRVQSAKPVKGGHVKLSMVTPRGTRLGGFAPNFAARLSELEGELRVTAELRRDDFRGGNELELLVTGFRPLAATSPGA